MLGERGTIIVAGIQDHHDSCHESGLCEKVTILLNRACYIPCSAEKQFHLCALLLNVMSLKRLSMISDDDYDNFRT